MVRVFKVFLLLAGAVFIAACGSEGGSGGGPTTYITPSIKDGTSLVAFSSYSSQGINLAPTKVKQGALSFTVKSNVYTGITPSDVQFTSQELTYTPVAFETYSTNKERISPQFTTIPVIRYIASLVPGGGNVDIENFPVFGVGEVNSLKPLVDADPAKFSNKLLKYRLDITFNGYEVRTNENVSGNLSTEVWVKTP